MMNRSHVRKQTTKQAPNFAIKEITETKGSGFVATRNIKAGEFICDDKPLIIDASTEGYMNAFNFIQNDSDHSYLLDYLCYPKDLQYNTPFDRFKKQIELNPNFDNFINRSRIARRFFFLFHLPSSTKILTAEF